MAAVPPSGDWSEDVFKLIVVVVAIVFVFIFATGNIDRVPVGFVVGQPIQMRLIFVILVSFLAGCLTTVLLHMYWAATSSRRGKGKLKGGSEEDPHF
jgi:uncharacterized integral membrane protein